MKWVDLHKQAPARGAAVLLAWKLTAWQSFFFFHVIDKWRPRLTYQCRDYAVAYWCEITDPSKEEWRL